MSKIKTAGDSRKFRLAFEAILGANTLGIIAIDDVAFDAETNCESSSQFATCTFERDTCGWSNDWPYNHENARAGVEWRRSSGRANPLADNVSGPNGDATLRNGAGWYMLFDPSGAGSV